MVEEIVMVKYSYISYIHKITDGRYNSELYDLFNFESHHPDLGNKEQWEIVDEKIQLS